MSLLEIYIPAYRRPKELDRLLSSIPPHDDVSVVVADNAQGQVGGLAAKHGVGYRARSHNVGGNANILLGIAEATAPWLWILGDDDWLLPGALDRVLDEIRADRADRIINYTHGAPIPANLRGVTMSDAEAIEGLRPAPSLLIATTLISANVYRTSTLDVVVGLRHLDSHYGHAWAGIGANRWVILDSPTIGVGTDHQLSVPTSHKLWQDYLDGLTTAAGVAPISVADAARWNFCSIEQKEKANA